MRNVIAAIVIGLTGTAILVSLGVWQVQRLAWKEGILAEIEARMAEPPAPVWSRVDPLVPYAPVSMRGKAGARELHVLVSHKQLGPGFRVITAFETEEGRRLLLDQGFIPTDRKDAPRRRLEGEVRGNLHLPDDRTGATPQNDPAANIWFARDIEQMAAELGTEPVLVILSEAEGLDPAITPLPVDTASIPNDHAQYAVTWFSLAAIWLGMTGYWLWRIRRRTA